MKSLHVLRGFLCASLFVAPALAQSETRIDEPGGRLGWLTRPYQARSVPLISSSNSTRLESLAHAGNLYLSARDVIALAIENNIDIEVQRYGPLMAKEILRRAESGGALRSVGLGVAPGPQSVTAASLSDAGSSSTAGSSGSSSSQASSSPGAGVSSGGGIVSQLGPPIPSFDPTISILASFAYSDTPLSNTVLVGTTSFVQRTRSFQGQYIQNWDFGLSAQVGYTSQYARVNSPNYVLNPANTASLDVQLTQNLLQGFGRAVNSRNIRVQKNNMKVTDLEFKMQVIVTVAAALNLYWDLVSFHDDLSARQKEVDVAQLLLDDNRKQVSIGAMPSIEVTRAEAQLYSSRGDLSISQTRLLQQEIILKNTLSRNGVSTPMLAGMRIVPVDSIATPDDEPIEATEELIQEALHNRIEVAEKRINLDSNRINLVGVKSSLKPTLQAFAEVSSSGLVGDLTTVGMDQRTGKLLTGGYGSLLAQIARRDFPNYAAGISLSIPLRNRAAQADYVLSTLEFRQNELALQKNVHQIRVDVESSVIGLQQARIRYYASLKARQLQDQTLEYDQKRLAARAGTIYQVVQDQRDLARAASFVSQAMASYTHARIALDLALGRTLETNHISIDEAQSGHVSQPSSLPANVPAGEKR